jgi:ABC-type uncharacterized transport system fused permease/ATPase subunit
MPSARNIKVAKVLWLICAYFANGSQERIFVRTALLAILPASVAVVALQIWINTINGSLFTALQNRDIHGFFAGWSSSSLGFSASSQAVPSRR